MSGPVLAVDIGGTWLRAGLVDAAGGVASLERSRSPASAGPEAVVEAVAALVEPMRARAGDLDSAGVCFAGPVDPARGLVLASPNLVGFHDFPLAARLHERLGVAVHLLNDASAAAFGEARHGAGRGHDPLLYITVSTGIGGGLVVGDRIFAGARGLAGEVGGMLVDDTNTLESLASGPAIAEAAKLAIAAGRETSLRRASVDAETVAEAARLGDTLARDLYVRAGRTLGRAFASLVNVLDPSRVVVGGGVAEAFDLWADEARRMAEVHIMVARHRPLDLVRAELGDAAGLVGVGAWVYSKSSGSHSL